PRRCRNIHRLKKYRSSRASWLAANLSSSLYSCGRRYSDFIRDLPRDLREPLGVHVRHRDRLFRVALVHDRREFRVHVRRRGFGRVQTTILVLFLVSEDLQHVLERSLTRCGDGLFTRRAGFVRASSFSPCAWSFSASHDRVLEIDCFSVSYAGTGRASASITRPMSWSCLLSNCSVGVPMRVSFAGNVISHGISVTTSLPFRV